MLTTVIPFLFMFIAVVFLLLRGDKDKKRDNGSVIDRKNPMFIDMHGNLLVSGHGNVVIEEQIPRHREMLVHQHEHVRVHFDPEASPCPPCVPHEEDVLRWEIIERRSFEHHGDAENSLWLKIHWRVACPRTIRWSIGVA